MSVCAPEAAELSRKACGDVEDRRCFDGSVKVGASEVGETITTDGKVEKQVTLLMTVR